MPKIIKCLGLADKIFHFEFWTLFIYSFSYISSQCYLLHAPFVGAMAIADLVKTTSGPKGMV
jgi:hypothetical protein